MTATSTTAPTAPTRGGGTPVIGVEDSQARAVAQALLGAPVGDDGLVVVSQADLASASGLPGRTLRRVLGRLRDAGWVGLARPATTRSPAAYDTTRLRGVAAEAGLVPTAAPAAAGAGGVVPVGVRRLTAAEAADPGGVVVVGGRYLVDPAWLQAGENVRRDLRVDPGFLETVRAHGVAKDLDVYTSLTGLVVLDGHRRLHAALALGLEEVAVRVVSCDGEAERIARQLMVNDEHAHVNAVERADAVTQLVLMGVPVAALRRRGVGAEEVEAARAVARAPQVVRDVAVARPGVDLLTLASLASLAAGAVPGSQVVARAAAALVERPEQAAHVASRAAYDVVLERLHAEAAAALETEGTPLHEGTVWADPGVEYLKDLVDEHGRDLDPAGHASCPGHAAVLHLASHWQTGQDGAQVNVPEAYRPRYVCTAWRDHHRKRAATAASGAACGPQDESARAARRDLVARNQAWDAANSVRRAWVRDVLLARRPPADAAVWQVPLLTGAPAWTTRASVARGWEHVGRTEAGSCHPATPAQAARDLVAWACVLAEGVIGRTTWRDAAPALLGLVRLHLRSLEAWGYTLADVEADLCRAVEAGGGDALHTLPGGGAR